MAISCSPCSAISRDFGKPRLKKYWLRLSTSVWELKIAKCKRSVTWWLRGVWLLENCWRFQRKTVGFTVMGHHMFVLLLWLQFTKLEDFFPIYREQKWRQRMSIRWPFMIATGKCPVSAHKMTPLFLIAKLWEAILWNFLITRLFSLILIWLNTAPRFFPISLGLMDADRNRHLNI